MTEQMSKFNYPANWGFRRNPARPEDLRVLNFDLNYDYDTLWNDAIQIREDTILLIGPPLYETAQWLNDNCYFLDHNDQKITWQYSDLDRASVMVLNTHGWMKELTLVTPYSRDQIRLNHSNNDFGGKKVIVTISKDHPVSWLNQWIDYHKTVHDLDGILLYNNRSSLYTSDQLELMLARDDMMIKVVDYDVPFGVMGGGDWTWEGKSGTSLPWDSDFSQYVMLEHAKWMYLHCARLVINADTDELLIINGSTLNWIADNCANSSNSVWNYRGVWIEPVNSQTGEIAERVEFDKRKFENYWHTRHSNHRGIGVKWMLNPQKNMPFQWKLHNTTGPHMMTNDISFGHYLAMNTSWSYKRDGFIGSTAELKEHTKLKEHLKTWKPGLGE